MATQRNHYGADFKARVALEALKGHKTINELVSHFGVHPTQMVVCDGAMESLFRHPQHEQFLKCQTVIGKTLKHRR
jgi:hypothetical protein